MDTHRVKKIKVMVVFGTRPEAIKMAPLVHELKKHEQIRCVVCVTAQHRTMLDQVLNVFAIEPDYDFDIMQRRQTLVQVTCRALIGLEEVIVKEKPGIVLVHGDTTTTLTGALAAFYHQVPVGHVEAGLRTYDKHSPYPEELNRQMTGVLADLHFAPTELARQNLLAEGKRIETVFVTGNTAIDALRTTVKPDYHHPQLDWVGTDRLILLTAHRRENLGERMAGFFRALRRIVTGHRDVKVIYPVHLNPRIREVAGRILDGHERVRLIEPLNVSDFHNFMARSHLVITDSGGIQEEAPALGKPVLVLRDTTERPEGIAAGTLRLAGVEEEAIFQMTEKLLSDRRAYNQMARVANPYGDGHAAERITRILLDRLVPTLKGAPPTRGRASRNGNDVKRARGSRRPKPARMGPSLH